MNAREQHTLRAKREREQHTDTRLLRPANFGDTLPPESAAQLVWPTSICKLSSTTNVTSRSPALQFVKTGKPKTEFPTTPEARRGAYAHLHRLHDVLRMTAVIEAILQSEFSGRGRGIHSKLDSCNPRIPEDLDRRLRYIGAVRNRAVYDPTYKLPDKQAFVGMCEQATSELVLLIRTHQRLGITLGHTRFGGVIRRIKSLL